MKSIWLQTRHYAKLSKPSVNRINLVMVWLTAAILAFSLLCPVKVQAAKGSKAIPVKRYVLTATTGTGGTISPSGAVVLNRGVSQAVSISPDAGYKIADVKVDGTSIGAVNSYNFTDLKTNHTISATFAPILKVTSNHWVDATIAKTSLLNGNPDYMVWCPVVADVTGTVTMLRVNIGRYGMETKIRLALYDKSRIKLTQGTGTVSGTGYKKIRVPATRVIKGNTYYIAIQADSRNLEAFSCGAKTGGFSSRNKYSIGFPDILPSGGKNKLPTAGMYLE